MNPRNKLHFLHYMPGSRAALLDGRCAVRVTAATNVLQQHGQSSSVATAESARVPKPSITFLRAGIGGAAAAGSHVCVSEGTAMKIGGWKTKAMFSRYNVVNTDHIRASMVKGAEYVEQNMKQA